MLNENVRRKLDRAKVKAEDRSLKAQGKQKREFDATRSYAADYQGGWRSSSGLQTNEEDWTIRKTSSPLVGALRGHEKND